MQDGEDNEVDGYDEEDGEPAADDLNASDAPMSEPSSRSATVQASTCFILSLLSSPVHFP